MAKMDREVKTLIKKGQEIARGLGYRGHLLKGSMVRYYNVCGKKDCRCKKGKRHGPYLYVSVYEGKKNRRTLCFSQAEKGFCIYLCFTAEIPICGSVSRGWNYPRYTLKA